jgi:hypothetical protein
MEHTRTTYSAMYATRKVIGSTTVMQGKKGNSRVRVERLKIPKVYGKKKNQGQEEPIKQG